MVHPPDLDDIGAGAHDGGAHGVEEVGQINDVWLPGGVFDDGGTLCHGGGQHDVHGGAHRDYIQIDGGALHPAFPGHGIDEAAADLHIGPHGGETLDVLVNGAAAEVTAAGKGHLCRAKPAEHGADEVVGGTNFSRQGIRHPGVADMGTVDIHRGAVHRADIGAQLLQNGEDLGHVADLRHIFNTAYPVHHQRGRQNSHRRIFGAGDLYCAVERLTTVNHVFCQDSTLASFPPRRATIVKSECPAEISITSPRKETHGDTQIL